MCWGNVVIIGGYVVMGFLFSSCVGSINSVCRNVNSVEKVMFIRWNGRFNS